MCRLLVEQIRKAVQDLVGTDGIAQSGSILHFKTIVYQALKFGSDDCAIQSVLSRDCLDEMARVALRALLHRFRAPTMQRL